MKKRNEFLVQALTIATVICASCVFNFPGASAQVDWSAHWIWTSAQGPNNTWLALRKKVTLSGQPTSAITKIAAENNYWLYVNGQLVVRGGGLDARPDLNNTYYDEIDLSAYLQDGDNIIAALAWHKGGEEGYSHILTGHGGFLFQSDLVGSSPSQVISDDSWKVTEHPAFVRGTFSYLNDVTGTITFDNATFGDPIFGVVKQGYYRLEGTSEWLLCANENESFALPGLSDVRYGSENNQMRQWNDFKWVAWPVNYDAQGEMPGWYTLGFNDDSWGSAVSKGVPPVTPWNNLVHRTIPLWKDFGLSAYLNQADLPATVSADGTITGDLGINIQGNPYLKVNAPAGVRIRIILNEFYHQEYITKDGVQEFECFAWQNSSDHTVKYEFTNVTGPVSIMDLKFRQTGYDADIVGNFSSSDPQLNLLWTKCKNTSYVCMRDIFYDCPNRERGQWWGDVSEQILYSFYLYDERSNQLAQKGFRELFNTQKANGSLYTTAPGNKFHLPDQNIAAVAILWEYYLYTGDLSLLQEVYPQAKTFIEYCVSTANSDGMLILQPGQGWDLWNWIDWGDNKDVVTGSANTVVNASYIVLLENMMKIAEALGQTADVSYYENLLTPVKNNFNDYFWNGSAYCFHNLNGQQSAVVDDRSNAWAVLAGRVDESKKAGVLDVLETRYDASPYQEMYVELAMSRLDPVGALDRMRARFSDMISSWSSTLWEEFPAKNSNNHAWSAGPLYHMSAFTLGIRPAQAAYSEYIFEPQDAGLSEISSVIPTVKGNITASYVKNDEGTFTQTLVSPPNTEAVVGIPRNIPGAPGSVSKIEVNGEVTWQNGQSVQGVPGVSYDSEDGQYIKYRFQPGNWTIVSVFHPVTLYEDCSYGGSAVSLGTGSYTLSQLQALGIMDNQLSSVKVQSGYHAVFYEHDNFKGSTQILLDNNLCLVDDGFNDKTTSIVISQGDPVVIGINHNHITATNNLAQVYPNPVSKGYSLKIQLRADADHAEFHVLDLLGESVFSRPAAFSPGVSIPTGNLAPGTYLLQLVLHNMVELRKVIVR